MGRHQISFPLGFAKNLVRDCLTVSLLVRVRAKVRQGLAHLCKVRLDSHNINTEVCVNSPGRQDLYAKISDDVLPGKVPQTMRLILKTTPQI